MNTSKDRGESGSSEAPLHRIQRTLFENTLDFDVQGGLVVLETGQIAEVTPPSFIPADQDTSIYGSRVKPLQLHVDEVGNIQSHSPDYDPQKPTIGMEIEQFTMEAETGDFWKISPDGETLFYPDGSREEADLRGHQAEILKNTTEGGSDVESIPAGFEEFTEDTIVLKAAKRRWLIQHGLVSPPVSGFPESVIQDDVTDKPYIRMLAGHMPRFLEYAPCVSEQLNIQWKSPEAGAFAINSYQMLQSVLNLVTSATPARDGSLTTTLEEHYEHNPEFAAAENAGDYRELALEVRRELGAFFDRTPYDWREFERAYGSPSGGIITKAAHIDLESFLRDGDQQLRDNETMTISRTLGWHTDRMRPERGVVEINNLSHGGDHPTKMPAAEETVIKVIGALQEYFDDSAPELKYKPDWVGIIPTPGERDSLVARQQYVDTARVNNLLTAMFGKERGVFTADWEETTPKEIFDTFVDFTNSYAREPISRQAVDEIHATLMSPPPLAEFERPNDVFGYFYEPRSKMTLTEAVRMADQKARERKINLPVNGLLRRLADYSMRHHRELAGARERSLDPATDTIIEE